MTRPGIVKTFLFLFAALSLAACSASTPSAIYTLPPNTPTLMPASDTPAPTLTFTPEPPTATSTTEPTATLSPTEPSTPTIAPSPTQTPIPTVAMVQTGIYNTGGCSVSHPTVAGSDEIDTEICVQSVEVTREHHLIFYISWKVTKMDEGNVFTKVSGQNDKAIYLLDNLGNRYNHFDGGGAAYEEQRLKNNEQVSGWFEFGKAELYAVTFSFYDGTHDIEIKGIPLVFPTIIFEAMPLKNYPLQLEYSNLKWAVGSLPDGSQGLIHQQIRGCTIQELPDGQPQGQLYNRSQEMGSATYAIYGAIDAATNSAYREYVVLGGPELVKSGQARFRVNIPLDESTVCVFDASDVLSKLSIRE